MVRLNVFIARSRIGKTFVTWNSVVDITTGRRIKTRLSMLTARGRLKTWLRVAGHDMFLVHHDVLFVSRIALRGCPI